MSSAQAELPIFIVAGANWTCEVKLDEDDVTFPLESQMMEAATKAIEVFKGATQSDAFTITSDEESPYIGVTVHVSPKGGDPEKGMFVYSHVALANGGFYKDSMKAFSAIKKLATQFEKENKEASTKLNKDIKNFDKMKRDFKPKKPRKKKGDK
jgi:hypothetical protein